ncbi:MAG TPA: non-homologous end-joining DNA ligase [Acidimicrobiales bacterium]|nr:non-homologous end-joining DNA ligase [Acidimicrobiales bacterium]
MSLEVGGRSLSVSNRDKVFWPRTGFTKGQLIDYYQAVAEVMVPHLAGRPITLRRWPDGVEGQTFFQKNAPRHPEWMETVRLGDVDYLRIDEPAALVWAANLAAIEIHPGLAPAPHLDRPSAVVFDLDPGPPADIITCCRVALILRRYLDRLGLRAWPKTSGSKGLQLYVPLNSDTSYDSTHPFGLALAHLAESEHPDLVVSVIDRSQRRKKVLIDWAQNAPTRTTVAVYSMRARERPSVSTPVTWDEVEAAADHGDAGALRFGPEEVLARVAERGDLMAPVLEVRQELPPVRT